MNLLPAHQIYWEKFKHKQLPQALLLIGQPEYRADILVKHIIASRLCTRLNQGEPCNTCPQCTMVLEAQHADIQWICPEKKGSPIKIDQIRELQATIHQTPQCHNTRFILIHPAETLNIAAANALLKILEEPPPHVCFILIATQIATIPATIISRCQIDYLPQPETENPLYLLNPARYAACESYKNMLDQQDSIIASLLAICKKKTHPFMLAEQWKTMDFQDLLWILYLIYAQILINNTQSRQLSFLSSQLIELSNFLDTRKLLEQIAKIGALQKKIIHNVNMNMGLALQELLTEL